jgi:hypothetical protein
MLGGTRQTRKIKIKTRQTRKYRKGKNLVLTFVLGNDRSYREHTEKYMKSYADKCAADFMLLTDSNPIIKKHNSIFKELPSGREYGGTAWFLKVSIIHHFLSIYDKVLWLDDSCIVSPDTDNIFNKVTDGSIAAVKDKQKATKWNKAYIKLMTEIELDNDTFVNSGVVVYTKKMKEILSIKNIFKHKKLFESKYPHQAFLSYILHKNKIPIVLLNKKYNDLYLHYKNGEIRTMIDKEYIKKHTSSIFHITGAWKNRSTVIKNIDTTIQEYMSEKTK